MSDEAATGAASGSPAPGRATSGSAMLGITGTSTSATADVFVVPGPIDTATGGFRYDRRIVAELRGAGFAIEPLELAGDWPRPSAGDRARAEAVFATIADGTRVVVDGLAFGALPELARRHGRRLRLVALVHHPLWLEEEPTLDEPTLDEPRSGGARRPPPGCAAAAAEIEALAHARRVIVTSIDTAAAVAVMGVAAERIAVVEPGCDPYPLARGSGGGPVRLLCVATVTPRKGYLDLVAALADIERALPGERRRAWRLDVVGSIDRDRQHVHDVRAAIAAAGLGDRIRLVGEVDEDDLGHWYDGADGMVLASHHEGYGMSLAEALMHGLPVVATRAGAVAATVDGAARLVTVGDTAALATAIADGLLDAGGRAELAAAAGRWRATRLERANWTAAARRFAAALADV
ncbi:MAG: glycosyltransferase family 4 protein [Burkholderiaceae bacterium]